MLESLRHSYLLYALILWIGLFARTGGIASAKKAASAHKSAPKKILKGEKLFNFINRLYYSQTNGCWGGLDGVDGSLNGRSVMNVLQALRAKGRTVLDIGAGDGRFMVAALAGGKARKVLGYELPVNCLQKDIFGSVLQKMTTVLKGFRFSTSEVQYWMQDINKVICIC
jgi:hypothetical protein